MLRSRALVLMLIYCVVMRDGVLFLFQSIARASCAHVASRSEGMATASSIGTQATDESLPTPDELPLPANEPLRYVEIDLDPEVEEKQLRSNHILSFTILDYTRPHLNRDFPAGPGKSLYLFIHLRI